MDYHQNSVSPLGAFKGMEKVEQGGAINFSMTVAEKQQLCSILAECMIAELLDVLTQVEGGDYYLHDDSFVPLTGLFDLGQFYEEALERCEQMIALKMDFDTKKIKPIILTFKVALWLQFKLFFCDTRKSTIIIFDKYVKPNGDYMDLHDLIQLTINRLGTFL